MGKIALLMGETSKKAYATVKRINDGLDLYPFTSIAQLITESNIRHIYFDRIILSKKGLTNGEQSFEELNNYLEECSSNTSIVFMSSKGEVSNGVIDEFLSYFNSPLYTPAIIDSVSPDRLIEFITEDIEKISNSYYINIDMVALRGNKVVTEDVSKPKGVLGKFFSKKNQNTQEENSEDTTVIPPQAGTFNWENVKFGKEEEIPEKVVEDDVLDSNALLLGEQGSQHTDTGYLDEDELKEVINGRVAEEDDEIEEDEIEEDEIEDEIEEDEREEGEREETEKKDVVESIEEDFQGVSECKTPADIDSVLKEEIANKKVKKANTCTKYVLLASKNIEQWVLGMKFPSKPLIIDETKIFDVKINTCLLEGKKLVTDSYDMVSTVYCKNSKEALGYSILVVLTSVDELVPALKKVQGQGFIYYCSDSELYNVVSYLSNRKKVSFEEEKMVYGMCEFVGKASYLKEELKLIFS